jgi:predicted AAA+ superfamily ATPase
MGDAALIKVVLDEWQDFAKTVTQAKFKRQELDLSLILGRVTALTGVRRSGKTFYAIGLAQDYIERHKNTDFLYINFEDPYFLRYNSVTELDLLLRVYAEYHDGQEPKILILDEIQNIHGWECWVRKYADLKKFHIIVTGSSAKLLSSEISGSLTGRNLETKIWPLSFSEFIIANPKKLAANSASFKKYLLQGAFPELHKIEAQGHQRQLHQYFEDILHKDIINRHEIRSVSALRTLASFVLTNLSSLHSTHSIKKALDINAETVREYCRFLEDACLFFPVARYHPNLKVQSRDAHKFYCIDTGLRNAIARSPNHDWGKLCENMVYIELKRRNLEVYYYREAQEVDFIVTRGHKAQEAIQVCYSDLEDKDTYERETRALFNCLEDLRLNRGLLLSKNREEIIKHKSKTVRIVPVYKWLCGKQDAVS